LLQNNDSNSNPDADSIALIELTPSLLRIEAERLGINPNECDTEELRRKIYKALSENISSQNNTDENKSCQDLEGVALTELSPSLLKIEAERLGIDPNEGDTEELRKKIYKALSENCLQRSDQ